MSWPTVVWNIFLWSITASMIYLTDSSMWWLILPSVFTALDNPQLHERLDKETVDEFGLDKDTRNKINKFLEQDRVNRKGNQ